MSAVPDDDHQEGRYGWIMVALACVIIGTGFGMLWSFSIFLKPLSTEFGWQRGDTSIAYSLAAFIIGAIGILTGALSRRFSTRALVFFGTCGLTTSMFLLSKLSSLGQLYVFYGLVGLSISALYVPLVSNVGFWFENNKGLAIGLTLGGQLAGAAFIPVIARHLITDLGWQKTYFILAVISFALIPLAIFIRQPPAGRKEAKDATATKTLETQNVISPGHLTVVLCCAILLCCIPMSVPLIHAVARSEDAGVPPEIAATILSVMMVAGFFGRVISGKLADHFGGLKVLMGASGLQTIIIFWFALVQTLPSFYFLATVFGLAYGGIMPSYALIIRERVSVNHAAKALGLVYFFAQIGMGFGGWLGGVAFDVTGDYIWTFLLGVPSGVLNFVIVLAFFYYIGKKESPPTQNY